MVLRLTRAAPRLTQYEGAFERLNGKPECRPTFPPVLIRLSPGRFRDDIKCS